MTSPTVAVTCLAMDDGGNPVSGAEFSAVLDITEIDGKFIAPEAVKGTTDETGSVVLNLWPNEAGFLGSLYKVKARNPDTGRYFVDGYARIPEGDCLLHECMVDQDGGVWAIRQEAEAITVSESRALSSGDNNKVLELEQDGINLTIPATGLQSDFSCLVDNNGISTVTPSPGVTINYSSSPVARNSSGNQMYLIRRLSRVQANYTVTGVQ